MEVYQLDKLMEETRQLAAKYKDATGQPLPVSHDLACYDAMRYLNLRAPAQPENSVDAVDEKGLKYQIKGRVQFANAKGKQQRIGQINIEGQWDLCLLVLLDEEYQASEIYSVTIDEVKKAIGDRKPNKRGAMTVPQFKAISQLIWKPVLQDTNLAEPGLE